MGNKKEEVKMDIKVKSKENPEGIVVSYELPTDLYGFTKRFGDEQTFALANRAAVLAIQALARQHLDKPQEEVQKLVDAWEPGVRQPGVRKSPLERATAALGAMSAEDLAALLEKVKAAKKNAG